MKKILFLALLCTFSLHNMAQDEVKPTVALEAKNNVRYGFMSYKAVLEKMPEYVEAQAEIAKIRAQYEAEAKHNEENFQKMFSDFLAGQKDFPQTILLKRQKELQEAMERGISFRTEAQKLVQQAEKEILALVKEKLHAAIQRVAISRGYEVVINTDEKTYLYLHPGMSENIEEQVAAVLRSGAAVQD